jgi:hypothetical protein
MIRIRTIPYKISFILIFSGLWWSAEAQITMGARGLGLGHATTGLHNDSWAIFSNPAMMNAETSLGFYGLRNYGFANITDVAATGSVQTPFGIAGIGFQRYGDDLFNETKVRFGYKNEWEMLHFGLVLNYNHLAIAQPYGSGGALGMNVGVAAQLLPTLWIGAKSTNINRPQYEFKTGAEDLPRDLSVGFSYLLEERALFVMDVVKDVRFPVSYHGGVEVTVIEDLVGRVGVTTEPLTYSFGFGYGRELWQVNVAVQHHELLGFSPGLDLLFVF